MSDPQSEPIGWSRFHEREVMLQLREPYLGVSYGYMPVVDKDGNVVAIPFLKGMLFVTVGEDASVLLVIRMPVPQSEDFMMITVHPKDVLHCTHIVRAERSPIIHHEA